MAARFFPRFCSPLVILISLFSVSSALGQSPICTSHPCLWMNTPKLEELRRRASANTARWQLLKSFADESLTATVDLWHLGALSTVGLITNDPRYCDKAIEGALAYARRTPDLYNIGYLHGYEYRGAMPNIAVTFDWCHSRLTPSAKTELTNWTLSRALEAFYETNPARGVYAWANNSPENNYYWGKMMIWLAGLVMYQDDPRAKIVLDAVLSKWNKEAAPMLRTWGKGGVFFESTNYDSIYALGLLLHAHRTATGEDKTADINSFMDESVRWRIFSTVPSLDRVIPFGTQSRYPFGPLWELDRLRLLVTVPHLKNPENLALGKGWLDSINPVISNFKEYRWYEFLFYPEETAAAPATSITPAHLFAAGPEVLIARSSWSRDTLLFTMMAGKLEASHQDLSVNGFQVYKGDWLLGGVKVWGHAGTHTNTIHQNNMTFGDYQQDWQVPDATWPSPAGWHEKIDHFSGNHYFVGQGAAAYVQDRSHGGFPILENYRRKFLYVSGQDPNGGDGCFHIVDEVKLLDNHSTLKKYWRLNSKNPFTIDAGNYTTKNDYARVTGSMLLPAANRTVLSKPVFAGPGSSTTPSSHQLEITIDSRQPGEKIVNVFCLRSESDLSWLPSRLLANSADVTVTLAGKSMAFFRTSSLTSIQAPIPSDLDGALRLSAVDLEPNVMYRISDTVASLDVASSSKGSLFTTFNVHAGKTLSITRLGAAPATPTPTPVPPTITKTPTATPTNAPAATATSIPAVTNVPSTATPLHTATPVPTGESSTPTVTPRPVTTSTTIPRATRTPVVGKPESTIKRIKHSQIVHPREGVIRGSVLFSAAGSSESTVFLALESIELDPAIRRRITGVTGKTTLPARSKQSRPFELRLPERLPGGSVLKLSATHGSGSISTFIFVTNSAPIPSGSRKQSVRGSR